ncbi:HAD-IB family hydrolase [Aquihabitans sp. G128]|uniref:HAD family hydrolase n=1 Tax=Aquihabitans sp. G128 TaxID=2849779 RepID=UPI001C22DD0A|nr:HAD-IB family hydrolase [Aquihabitans sp. G128]QXC61321.1 HAD-IB family hydrolase [Aquihabitans sp. G128]
MPPRRIAAFDFDGTLTQRDTLLPFLVRTCGSRQVARAVSAVAPLAARARLGRLQSELHHRDAVKEALLAALLRGREAAWFREAGADYARTLPARIRPDMAEQVAWHREHGHELVIVSASLLTYLAPYASAERFDHVIAVEMEVGADDRLTGRLASPNVRGPEKAVRLDAWLDGDHPEVVWAYGNSSGDTELLERAHVPVWVGKAASRNA